MADKPKAEWKPEHSIVYAQACCLCLGFALLVWAVAPMVVERMVTGDPPRWQTIASNGVVIWLGVTYLVLNQMVRRRIRWAAWIAFLLALLICSLSVAMALFGDTQGVASFLIVLSACTSVANWFAITVLTRGMETGALAPAGPSPAADATRVGP